MVLTMEDPLSLQPETSLPFCSILIRVTMSESMSTFIPGRSELNATKWQLDLIWFPHEGVVPARMSLIQA